MMIPSIIRGHPQLKQFPVILQSAMGAPGDIQRGLSAGANEYLVKPLDFDRFIALIEKYMAPE